MDKPQEIKRFATMAVIACLINTIANMRLMNFELWPVLISLAGMAALIGLILCVAIGRSAIARVVVTIWIAFVAGSGFATYALLLVQHQLATLDPGTHVFSLIAILADCFALYFVWTAQSSAWLQKRSSPS
jgi:hypothetical protein